MSNILNIILTILKIVFTLGFLIFIHEGGHFIVAKLCKVKVKEFAIGFGPKIYQKQGKETLFTLRLVPLGGFNNLDDTPETPRDDETEEEKIERIRRDKEREEDPRNFRNAKNWKRFLIVLAGGVVNIVFGLLILFILFTSTCEKNNGKIIFDENGNPELIQTEDANFGDSIFYGGYQTKQYIIEMGKSIAKIFSGNIKSEDVTGPVGIGKVISQTEDVKDFVYLIAVISVSLGVTNLLPIPALDGFKLIMIIYEAIRKKKIDPVKEANLQLIGFSILIILSIFVTWHDITG